MPKVAERRVAIALSVFVVLLRLGLAVMYMGSGVWAFVMLGLAEGWAAVSTIGALSRGEVSTDLAGYAVPGLYMLPLVMRPGEAREADLSDLAMLVVLLMKYGVRAYLGWACTVGVPVYVGMRKAGPYRLCRHPLATLAMLSAVAACGASPSWYNVVAAAVCIAGSAYAALIEEDFLTGKEEYREYAKTVTARFIPGII